MQISLLTPGRLKKNYLREGCDDFLSRLHHYARVQVIEVREEPAPKGSNPAIAKRREAERLLRKVPPAAIMVALDEQGRSMTSSDLAAFLRKYRDQGQRHLAFIVGGPLGLAPSVVQRAALTISLSAMTFPHELARLILLEQFYRAFTILHGEPYHNP